MTVPTWSPERASIDFDAVQRNELLLVQLVERFVLGGHPLARRGPGYRSLGGPDDGAVTLRRTEDGAWKWHNFKLGEDGDAFDVLKLYAGAHTVVEAARMLDALPPAPVRITQHLTRPTDHPTPPRWTVDHAHAEQLVAGYARHPDALAAWRRYKPVTRRLQLEAGLGYGILPRSETVDDDGTRRMVHPRSCSHERLIYPVRRGGLIVAIRGRHAGCPCDPVTTKWVNATGSTAWLYGLESVRRGDRVVVCENPVDAILARRVDRTVLVVASTGGAGTWRPEWTRHLAVVRPAKVLVWFDHDLAGNCGPDHCPTCRAAFDAWSRAHDGKTRPPPNGPKVAALLRAAGLPRVEVHHWEPTARHGADLGDVLADYLAQQQDAALATA